jgi:hypothetical protein
MSRTQVPLKYGLSAYPLDPNPPFDPRTGKIFRDAENENTILAVEILDLLCEAKNGELEAQNAIRTLEIATLVIKRYQANICLGAMRSTRDESRKN